MFWGMTLFLISCFVLLGTLSIWLRATFNRNHGAGDLSARLAVPGVALTLVGMIAVQVRGNVYARAGQFFLENFGWLMVISGLMILFMLFCVSRMASVITATGKRDGNQENPVSEYLR